MQLVRSRAARFVAPCLLLAALVISSCASSREVKSARFVEAGKKLLEKKDAARAILQFQNAISQTPRNADVHYQLALAFLAAGDLRDGMIALNRAVELNPKHKEAQLKMAEIMSGASEKKYLEDARGRLQSLVQDSPENPAALQALGLTELKLGESDDAIEHLERALRTAPQELLIAVTLARAKLQQGDAKGAEEVLKKASQDSPKSAAAAAVLGEFYASQRRPADAEQQYRRALTLDPQYAVAVFDLSMLQIGGDRKAEAEQGFKQLSQMSDGRFKQYYGIFLLEQNRKDEALREFERLSKEDPSDRSTRTRLVLVYRSLNRESDAERVIQQALNKNPKDLDALLQRAEISLAAKKYPQAESDLNQVIHLSPDSAEPHYVMAKLHAARGETASYRAGLFKALELSPYALPVRLELAQSFITSKLGKEALEVLDHAPDSQKSLTAMLLKRNWALWTVGDLAGMRKGIDVGLSRQRSPEFLLQDGLVKLSTGNVSGARSALEEALKLNPADVRAMSALTVAYKKENHDSLALQKVKEYASRQPNSAPVQEFLGVLLMVNGDRQEARTAFNAALAVDPKYVRANMALIQVEVAEGKWDSAEKRLSDLVSSDGTNAVTRRWLGNVKATKGDYKSAIEEYRQAVALDPDNAESLNNLAYLLAEFGNQTNEALKYAQKAKELAPDNPGYSDTLGWILYHKGLYPSAVAELERAASQGGNASWKFHLAMAYAKVGDLKRGRGALQSGLRENPYLPEAKLAREMLGQAQ
jgi:tetratricopeptide (TPR) repeat protein